MNQPKLLERAKQGDEEAIASVMNYLLKDKGITAQAAQKDDCLLVVLKSAQVPEQKSSVATIYKLMMKLNLASIKAVKVYGKQTGQPSPAWTETLNLTSQIEKSEEQSRSSETSREGKLNAIADRWPAWFPYPSSWLRTFALVLWSAVILRIAGFWSLALGGILAIITARLELLLSFLGLGLLVSILTFSYLHHFLFSKSLPRYPRWLPSPRSLWEGLYAPIVMLLAFVAALFILVPFLIPNCNYGTSEPIGYCFDLTGRELVKYEYRMAEIGAGIWLISAVYLYQAEYLIRRRLIPKLNVALQNPKSRKKRYQIDDTDVEIDHLRGEMGLTQMKKGKVKLLRTKPLPQINQPKPQKLAKKLLIILLVPLIAVGVYLFSKLPELKGTIPAQTASQAPSVKPMPVISASPATAVPDRDTFGEAVNKAMSAATHTQSAKSKDDWNLVASQWQEAIALMKAVPSSHSQYTVAQQKAVEYQRNLDYAQKNSASSR